MSLDKEIEVIGSELIKVSLDGNSATRLLVGNLVNFLASKNIINRDEYLEYIKETRDFLSNGAELDDEAKIDMIKTTFDLHINDFQKPE